MIGCDPVCLVGVFDFQGDLCFREFLPHLLKHRAELSADPVQLAVVQTANLAVQECRFRNDVALQPGIHSADVGSGFFVDATQGQPGYDFGGNQDGRQSLFRFDPGVGGPARDVGFDHVLRRRGHGDTAHRPFAVENHAHFCIDKAEIQVVHPNQATLLVTGEDHLYRPVGNPGLLNRRQRFQYDGEPCFAVPSQYGGPVGPQRVPIQKRLDSPAGIHGVHV